MKRKRRDWSRLWFALLIVGAIIATLMKSSVRDTDSLPRAGFSDGKPLGGKGLSLMLGKMGYRTARQVEALKAMPADAKIWLILDPETRFSADESKKLLAWVRAGGVLLFCVRPQYSIGSGASAPSEGIEALQDALGVSRSTGDYSSSGQILPALSPLTLDPVSNYRAGIKKATGSSRTFTVTRPHLNVAGPPGGSIARIDGIGKGRVFVLSDALLVTNYALSKDDNATLVANLLRNHSQGGTVYFDERNHGGNAKIELPPSIITYLKKPPVSYAVWQLLAAGLLIWAFAGRRLGAPVPLPGGGPVTRASQFAAAMGALFSKTNRPEAAAAVIGLRFRRRLAQRLGLSPAESDSVLAKRAEEVGGIPFDFTDRLLLQSRTPAQSVAEALRDAQQMEAVLRKLEGKS